MPPRLPGLTFFMPLLWCSLSLGGEADTNASFIAPSSQQSLLITWSSYESLQQLLPSLYKVSLTKCLLLMKSNVFLFLRFMLILVLLPVTIIKCLNKTKLRREGAGEGLLLAPGGSSSLPWGGCNCTNPSRKETDPRQVIRKDQSGRRESSDGREFLEICFDESPLSALIKFAVFVCSHMRTRLCFLNDL